MFDRIPIIARSNIGMSRRVADLLASQFRWPRGEISGLEAFGSAVRDNAKKGEAIRSTSLSRDAV